MTRHPRSGEVTPTSIETIRKRHAGTHGPCWITDVVAPSVDPGTGDTCDASALLLLLDGREQERVIQETRIATYVKQFIAIQEGFMAAERALTDAMRQRDAARSETKLLAESLRSRGWEPALTADDQQVMVCRLCGIVQGRREHDQDCPLALIAVATERDEAVK